MILGLGQILVKGGDQTGNLMRAEEAVRDLAGKGAQLVLLPEALNLGWTHPSCFELAETIPDGVTCRLLARLAKELDLHLVGGLVERNDKQIFNSAVLIDPNGNILLKHRKINELDFAQECYALGTQLEVADTALGRLGLIICADGFAEELALSRSAAMMGAQMILSPCAWAVPADFNQAETPYGKVWIDSYTPVCEEYGIVMAGCSNVGPITAGPWKGRRCIGNSLVMGPKGNELLRGPFDESANLIVALD